MKQKIIMCVGLPASGKDFWASKIIKKNLGKYKRVNKDLLREMLDANEWSPYNEKFVLKVRNAITEIALQEGFNVIISDTNLHPKHKNTMEQIATKYNAEIKIKDFRSVPIEVCIERDKKREKPVNEKIIRQMYNHFMLQPITPDPTLASKMKKFVKEQEKKDYTVITPIEQDETLPPTICCDLDGTLAKLHGRNPYNASTCEQDELNIPISHILKLFHDVRGYKIILLSGREDKDRLPTEKWLAFHGIPYEHLFMRKTGDHRKDAIIKKEIFDAEIKDKYKIEFAIDDRISICRLWYCLGIPLFRVGNPDANF